MNSFYLFKEFIKSTKETNEVYEDWCKTLLSRIFGSWDSECHNQKRS